MEEEVSFSPQAEDISLLEEIYTLWLINDDYNTFEFVIENLMELCKHTYEQAMQCAFITHHHGKCDVLRAEYTILEKIANIMLDRGLTVKILL